jgi:hypothetical protein
MMMSLNKSVTAIAIATVVTFLAAGVVPRLLHAKPEQRQHYELSAGGIHWDALDDDISVEGLLAGRGDYSFSAKIAAGIAA